MERKDLDQDPLGLQPTNCKAGREQAAVSRLEPLNMKSMQLAGDEKLYAPNVFLITRLLNDRQTSLLHI